MSNQLPSDTRVLLVSEENSTISYIQLILASMGYDVELHYDPHGMVQAFRNVHPAIAIIDLDFAGLWGSGLLEQIHRASPSTLRLGYANDPSRLAPSTMVQLHDSMSTVEVRDHFLSHFSKLLEQHRLRQRLQQTLADIVGHSPHVHRLYRLVEKAALSKGSVLIRGESGVGKELVARAIASTQSKFVVVNCSAIPENLFESELFGHMRGAFTGANADRMGLFEEASGGCLFLDEIGDLPTQVQTKLLRALQEGEIRPVGANITRKVSVRIIAATNRNLEKDIAQGTFRDDLYYRINVIPIEVPALRERREDIPDLVQHFLRMHGGNSMPTVSAEAWKILQSWDWPGNVRELENVVHRAIALMEHNTITAHEIQLPVVSTGNRWEGVDYATFRERQLAREREFLSMRIREHDGSITRASEALGLSRTALHNRAARIGLDLSLIRQSTGRKHVSR